MGMLAASLFVAILDMVNGADVALRTFVMFLPRSFLFGDLPSLLLALIMIAPWKKFRMTKLVCN